MQKLFAQKINTPLGILQALSTDKGVCFLEFEDQRDFESHWNKILKFSKKEVVEEACDHLQVLEKELDDYFKGELKSFTTPMDVEGTVFQHKVWQSLIDIDYGAKTTYAHQSTQIENPKAVRAVANAIGQNRIAIIIPCHRVIGSDGSLTGYAGGLWRKEKLLALEELNK